MLHEKFAGLIDPSEETLRKIWSNAIIIVDTNVLLNFYRYSTKDTYSTILNLLTKLKENNRLYIPHQVALEYFFNYDKVIDLQHQGLHNFTNRLSQEIDNITINIQSIFDEYQKTSPHLILDNYEFLSKDLQTLKRKIIDTKQNEVRDLPNTEEIQSNLLKLLDGLVVGEPYDKTKLDEYEKIAEERYANKIPPGWQDGQGKTKKDGIRVFGDYQYQQKYGDFILWNQIIDRVRNFEDKKPIIFVTEDQKEDWWIKKGNKILRPQPHLIKEFLNMTGEQFHMYRIDDFVNHSILFNNIVIDNEILNNVSDDIKHIRNKNLFNISKLSSTIKEITSDNSSFKEIQLKEDLIPIPILSKKQQLNYIKLLSDLNLEEGKFDVATLLKSFTYLELTKKDVISKIREILQTITLYDSEFAEEHLIKLNTIDDKAGSGLADYYDLLSEVEYYRDSLLNHGDDI
ncbi:PIN-like domain-containing protein [Peribacillus simplex]|uniref:PIN-like domain-containing protein n=1 Tax=Peribacillus simplex TaxID=1478 RepID=UPI003B8E9D26